MNGLVAVQPLLYIARLHLVDECIHRYPQEEIEELGLEYVFALCQMSELHPTPHTRAQLVNELIPSPRRRLDRCSPCFEAERQ